MSGFVSLNDAANINFPEKGVQMRFFLDRIVWLSQIGIQDGFESSEIICRVKDESEDVGYICFQIVVSSHFPWRRPVCLGRHLFLSFFEFLWKIFA